MLFASYCWLKSSIRHIRENNRKSLIQYVTSRKALVRVLSMAESEESSCYAESDSDSFLSGSVNYSTDTSDDVSVSDTSVPTEFEVASEIAPYRFEPVISDSELMGPSGEVDTGESAGLSPERVGNNDW